MAGKTLYDKVWDAHAVKTYADGATLLYIDRQLVHEVSSPQAFAQLAVMQRVPWRRDAHLCVADHAVPTVDRDKEIGDPLARAQVTRLQANARQFELSHIPFRDIRQGIVHVIGPETAFTQPGITLVCGDSHTCTHGAFGALAFGIGSSECEAVIATQCLRQTRARNMRVWIDGELPHGVTSKDLILALIARIGTSGAAGCVLEFAGPAVDGMSMEARMTLCNMSIEAGARVGMIAPDAITIDYLKDRRYAPQGEDWDDAVEHWQTLRTDPDAIFHREERIDAASVEPQVSWGTSPEQTSGISGRVPDPAAAPDAAGRAEELNDALSYMDLTPGMPLKDVTIDHVFIGSCTNGRIEDLRSAATIIDGHSVASGVRALVVPGSGSVKARAEAEGLDKVFIKAGFEWRSAGCSMCVAMNTDRLKPGERCASTSNRNFRGRQGQGGRTHLMSPAMAAAAAITGHLTDVRDLHGSSAENANGH